MKAFDDLAAAVDAADAELEKVKGLAVTATALVTQLQATVAANTIDPAAAQALTSKLTTTIADVESTLNPPAPTATAK